MNKGDRLQLEGQLREAIRQAEQDEIEQRIRNHKLKVTRFERAEQFRKTTRPPPLEFLAIRDSWFDYPLDGNYLVPPYSFGIVADQNLGSMGTPPPLILSLAKAGQASTAVLSWQNQEKIVETLTDPSHWASGQADGILVSAGGDDIAGDQLAIYLTYGGGSTTASTRFDGVLDLVTASYAALFALRDAFAPGTPIFGHCYDYALPNGIPAAFILGPWMKPSFDFALYGFPDAQKVVMDMIGKFRARLTLLASNTANNFHLVDTTGIVKPNNTYPDGWANELHPYTHGFYDAAGKFLVSLRAYFPGRI
jgi:hypothetical protein